MIFSAKFVKNYCEAVFGSKAIYVLGANCELLTRELYNKLVKILGKEALKDIVIERDEGKLASDCSGLCLPLSGSDKTADGYYKSCTKRGKIEDMPLNMTLTVYRESKSKKGTMEHMGIYTGDNTTYEMNNGCEKKTFDPKKWTHYGIPDWIEQEQGKEQKESTVTSQTDTTAGGTALAGASSADTAPGESVKFYPKYTGASGSIVNALTAVGEKNTSFANRKKIAAANGMKNYTGTAAENTELVRLLKKGNLKKA